MVSSIRKKLLITPTPATLEFLSYQEVESCTSAFGSPVLGDRRIRLF